MLHRVQTLPLGRVAEVLDGVDPRQVLHAFIVLIGSNEERLSRLLARNDIARVLNITTREIRPRDAERIFRERRDPLRKISVALITNLNRTGVTYQHGQIVHQLAELLPKADQFDFYAALVDAVNSEPGRSRISRKDGLHSLYLNAAEAAFRSSHNGLALTWCRAALDLADSLPDDMKTARARFTGRKRLVTYLVNAGQDEFAEFESDAHAGIDRELRNVLRFNPADSRLPKLEAALSRAQLVRTADFMKLRGRLTAAEDRVRILHRALADAYDVTCTDDLLDAAALAADSTEPQRRALARVLVELAASYSRMGDDVRATWYVQETGRISTSWRHLLDTEIDYGLATTDLAQTVLLCERLVREHVGGSLAQLTDHQRSRVLGRYYAVARKLNNMLRTNKEFSGAAFWALQAEYWKLERFDRENRWNGPADAPSGSSGEQLVAAYVAHVGKLRRCRENSPPADADTIDRLSVDAADGSVETVDNGSRTLAEQVSERLQDVGRLVAEEDVNAIISLLSCVYRNPSLATDAELGQETREALAKVVAWRPRLFETVATVLLDREPQDEALAELCLRLAVLIARTYLPHRTIPLLLELSQYTGLTPAERLAFIEDARAIAVEQGRFTLALRSFRYWLRLPDELRGTVSDDLVSETLSDMLRHSDHSTGQLGISGVFDRAFALATELANLAQTLVGLGRYRLAFHTSALAQSRIHWALEQNPESVEELGHAMKVRASNDAVDLEHFHAAVLTRVCSSAAGPLSFQTLDQIRQADEARGESDTVTVRLVSPSSGRIWAIGRGIGSGYFAVPLPSTTRDLSGLADAVWFRMRDPDNQAARDHCLRKLWESCIDPIWPRLADAERVTFAFHDKVPFLPLHGALGPDGYLGVILPVDYEVQPGVALPSDPVRSAASPEAAVLGWDPQTASDQEVVSVTHAIGDTFTLVPSRDAQSAVTDVILNPARDLAVLHVAGHGHLESYPHAMHSSVELSPSATVTAHDLVTSGCHCRFVFLNVCSVGHSQTTAGDAYGFALAVRSRGTQAFLAPATFIAPTDAKTFATLFYAAALHQDTTCAVRQVAQQLVADGAAPAAWMPYAIFGHLPSLL